MYHIVAKVGEEAGVLGAEREELTERKDRGGVTLMVDEQEQRVDIYRSDIKTPAATQ